MNYGNPVYCGLCGFGMKLRSRRGAGEVLDLEGDGTRRVGVSVTFVYVVFLLAHAIYYYSFYHAQLSTQQLYYLVSTFMSLREKRRRWAAVGSG